MTESHPSRQGGLTVAMRFLGVLQGLARMLVSRQMTTLSVLFGDAMGMRRNIV